MIVISDNSVLSSLAEIGELDLLHRLYGTVTVTEAIRIEAMHPGAPDKLRDFFSRMPEWVSVFSDESPYLEETGVLDSGEASAITLAWRHRGSSLLILDEKRGRKVAITLGLRVTGTAGLLTDAAAMGLVEFEDALSRLLKTGFRLNPTVVDALRESLARRRQPPSA